MDETICEICEEVLDDDAHICGCEQCGRLFGPCCNSVEDDYCVECVG